MARATESVQAKDLDSEKSAGVGSEPKVDKYEERPYWDALTPEHKKVLEEAGQLPPKPSSR